MAYVTGKSGSFVINGTKNLDFKVYWQETYDIATNTSIVKLTPYCIIQVGGGGERYYLDGTISCNGVQLVTMESTTPTHYFDGSYHIEKQIIVNTSKAQLVLTSSAIAHNADGSKSVTISANFYGYTVSHTGIHGFQVYGSHAIALTSIPRKATLVSAPNFNDEENPTITYSNLAGNAVDALEAAISLTGSEDDIAYRAISKTGTSYTFNLTTAERNVLRAAASTSNTIEAHFYVRTTIAGAYHYSWMIKTLTIVNANPVISPTIVDTNSTTVALTGDSSKFIRYYSNAKITMGISALKSATMDPADSPKVSKSVTNSGKTLTADGTISGVTSGSFAFSATDSRGNRTTKTVNQTMINYIPLTCGITNDKPTVDGDFTFKVTGNYFNGSFGAVSNTLTVYYRYKVYGGSFGNWSSMSTTKSGNTYVATTNLTGLDYQTTYVFEAYAVDKLATVYSASKNIKASPVFDWSADDFNFNVPVYLNYGEKFTTFKVADETAFESELTNIVNDMSSNNSRRFTFMIGSIGGVTIGDWQWIATIHKTSAKYAFVSAQCGIGSRITKIEKVYSNGVWQPCEWKNPPMENGVEYRTTKRYGNKVVYTKFFTYVNSEAFSGVQSIYIPHGISNLDLLIFADIMTSGYFLPYTSTSGSLMVTAWSATNIGLVNTGTSWAANRQWYITLEYTKTT